MNDLTRPEPMRMSGLAPLHRKSAALWLAALLLGVGLVASCGLARAADDDDDDTFEEKIIGGIMRGLGGTNMENSGIQYRERSPLVVPPKIELRPPDANVDAKVANWPKDPDIQRRKAALAASRKSKPSPEEAARPLMPNELAQRSSGSASVGGSDSTNPGVAGANPLSPSQLGFTGFGKMFGGNTAETAPFAGEPKRDSLTQPPVGYQTPSPAFAYGTGPKESLNTRLDVMTGKEVKN